MLLKVVFCKVVLCDVVFRNMVLQVLFAFMTGLGQLVCFHRKGRRIVLFHAFSSGLNKEILIAHSS